RVEEHEPAPTIDLAAEHVHDIRWWTLDELDAVDPKQLAPRGLARRLRAVVERGAPAAPIDVGV
ncbi:MAG: NUDIX hydrolase, partial [Gaiellaceae bacterium]